MWMNESERLVVTARAVATMSRVRNWNRLQKEELRGGIIELRFRDLSSSENKPSCVRGTIESRTWKKRVLSRVRIKNLRRFCPRKKQRGHWVPFSNAESQRLLNGHSGLEVSFQEQADGHRPVPWITRENERFIFDMQCAFALGDVRAIIFPRQKRSLIPKTPCRI